MSEGAAGDALEAAKDALSHCRRLRRESLREGAEAQQRFDILDEMLDLALPLERAAADLRERAVRSITRDLSTDLADTLALPRTPSDRSRSPPRSAVEIGYEPAGVNLPQGPFWSAVEPAEPAVAEPAMPGTH